jgi:hypothetical protein
MPKPIAREHWGPGGCNEPQPYHDFHACSRLAGHRKEHRVRLGQDDLAWTDDGPVEVLAPLPAKAYVKGVR